MAEHEAHPSDALLAELISIETRFLKEVLDQMAPSAEIPSHLAFHDGATTHLELGQPGRPVARASAQSEISETLKRGGARAASLVTTCWIDTGDWIRIRRGQEPHDLEPTGRTASPGDLRDQTEVLMWSLACTGTRRTAFSELFRDATRTPWLGESVTWSDPPDVSDAQAVDAALRLAFPTEQS